MAAYIIVVSYNGMKWLEKCLKSCADYNVIVVDNASKDNTVSYIKKEFPQVKLLEQQTNLGFGQANNLGITYALNEGADYVFLLNQDAYLKPNTLNELINVHENNTDYAVLSPIQLNGEGNKLDRNFSKYLKYDYNNFFHFDAITKNLSKIYQVPFVNAASWLIPKETLLKIGGFDPIFFHYGEDDNYCQRLRYHKLKVGIVPDAFVMHDREFENKGIDTKTSKYKEWKYKLNWANLNLNYHSVEIKQRVREIKNSRINYLLKFNLSSVKQCNKELKLIYCISDSINQSRATNKTLGKHYI
ncbi:glycosyltransferase family 2 protein [Algibacter amylolyticus]|uniref:Glycosyltransferase family 2 protein n=1 Tax=Algibacter amylolyticus TaxID=1608400 RepID=A0A5M7AZ69_9FLAO|nr:glycosyltransferase family 2 protein [Algibacter amylolyticus]KAA5822449.1 glycosyltransferase family 2 protein [Algibacter amylolyticus]MBB5269172.1 GT2 family glycosyltransferase [Algibacter amylolyticus]TSJ73599.1 glycosyltransferase family 2 protein [Algibacter amylolyticus]